LDATDKSGSIGFRSKGFLMAVRQFLQKALAALALVTIALMPLSCANAQNAETALAGKWIIVMSRGGYDHYVWLVDLAKSDKGAWQAKLIDSSKSAPEDASLDAFAIAPPDVRLVLKVDDDDFEFRGKLDKGTVWGSIFVGGEAAIPARLVATKASSLKKYDAPQESPGRDDFIDAISKDEPFGPLLRFARQNADSPLALDVFKELIGRSRTEKYDEAKMRKLVDDYRRTARRWGPLLELRAVIDAGAILSRSDYLPELALEYINTAEKMLTDEAPQQWKLLLGIEKGKRLLAGKDPAEGLKLLTQLHNEKPFDPEITLPLAQHAEKEKNIDSALELYGELAALPMMEQTVARSMAAQASGKVSRDKLPSRIVARLWKDKHGDTEGLADFLNEIYEKQLRAIARPRVAPRKNATNAKVVLCELFTGSECPPCVAADVATTALEATYAESEVIVLRYHQHNPAPDPLANEETDERFSSYDAQGTPALYVNGKDFSGAGGFMEQVPEVYRRLLKTIEPVLAEATDVKIELSAEAKDGKVAISARADGPEAFPKEVHLHLVLAEDKVPFLAGNGIRSHEMVVRAMPGGPDGLPPKKGKLTYTGEVDLAQLKSQLAKHLARIESQSGTEFSEKPLELKSLHLVAFVQNDDTDEVLQAAAVPVTGDLTTAAIPAPAATDKTPRSKPATGGTD
jgi:hypothetical protein